MALLEGADELTDPTLEADDHAGFDLGLGRVFGMGSDSGGRTDDEAPQRVRVDFSMVVDRIIEFGRRHNFDSNEGPLIRVHRLLQSHVLKARSSDDGSARMLSASEMTLEQLDAFHQRQDVLDGKGATRLALQVRFFFQSLLLAISNLMMRGHLYPQAIATHAAGVTGNSAGSAIELLQELLATGNPSVQASVFEFVTKV